MTDYELRAELRDEQVLKSLQNIDKGIERLAARGESAMNRITGATVKAGVAWDNVAKRYRNIETGRFVKAGDAIENIGKQSQVSATKMGLVAGATTAVTNKLLEMGQAGVRAFTELIKGSVDAAKSLETVEASLIGIFEGNEDAALASLGRIREESIRLGVDLSELAPAFLPKVEDLDQFTKIAELAAGLARLDPAQGAAGARIALQEALSGDPLTLRRRFELDIRPIQEAQKELGTLDGLLVGLEQVLRERGQDFESLSDTAAFTFGQTQALAQDAQKTLGEPILDALKEDFSALNEFLIENKDSIDLIAGSIGDLIADIADLSGDQIVAFVEGIDLDKLQQFILDTQNLIDIIQTIREVGEQDPLPGFEIIKERIPDILNLQTALTSVVKIMGIINATASAGIAALTGYFDIMTRIAQGDISFSDISEQVDQLGESVRNAARDSINDSIGEMNERLADNEARLQERIDAQNESNDADLAAANAALANKRALEDEAKAAEEAAKAQADYNEAREELEINKDRAAQDLALKQQRALLDAEIEFAEKREDLARKNAQAIEDINRKNAQKLAAAATDLRRDEEDIARRGARRQIEIEREAANRRVEIETDFRRELERIRDRFDFDAQEAIRQNDAIAFLRIQRRKDFELQQARQQRDEEVQDAETAAVEQRQKLQEQLQAQIEDARIANQRKLEDLRVALAQELAAQQIKYAREVQQAKIAEQRKREELARTFQRQNDDFQRFWERKLQDLERNYRREIEIMRRFEAQKAQIQAESRARARLTTRSTLSLRDPNAPRDRADAPPTRGTDPGVQLGIPSPSDTANPLTQTNFGNPNASDPFERLNNVGPGRRFGGYTPAGISFLVGEDGPEIVRFRSPVDIYSNARAFRGGSQTINNFRRNTNLNIDAIMNQLSPQQIAIVQQLVNQMSMSLYR